VSLVALTGCLATYSRTEPTEPPVYETPGLQPLPMLEAEPDVATDGGVVDRSQPATTTGSQSPIRSMEEVIAASAPQRRAEAKASADYDPRPAEALGGASLGDAAVGRSAAIASRGARSPADGYAVGAPPPSPPRTLLPDLRDPSAPVGAEDYTDYGVRDFALTERSPMTTFAADVDTASYTVARRKLREGYLPPTSAVRVEEFVNYFPYDYAQPRKGEPFAVDAEAAPSPFNQGALLLRIGVQGRTVTHEQRKPVNLTFLVDVSGSMRGTDRIELVKETIKMLTTELEDGDTIAIATYAGSTRVALDPTPVSKRAEIHRAIDGLMAGGSTAMGAGIDLAYGLAERSFRPGAVNRVIIASDGDANVGQTSHAALSSKIRGHAEKGITLTTLGFGNGNYKDTMMERLANDGDGNYFYIDGIQESRRIFVDKLSSTLEVVAKDVKLQVEFDPSVVRAYRLVGYENRHIANRDFRNDKVDAGEIGSGHQVTALFEVLLEDGVTGPLGQVRIRNKAPGPDSPAVERAYALPKSIVKPSLAAASRQLRLQAAVAAFAEVLRGSPHVAELSLGEVLRLARSAQRGEYTEDAELIELIERAIRLRGDGSISAR